MDIKTLVLALALGNLSLCAALFFFEYDNKKSLSMSTWAVAKQCQAAAWCLLYFRGVIPDFLSVLIGNALLFTGMALDAGALWDAARRMAWRRPMSYALGLALATFAFCYGFDVAPALRSGAGSLIVSGFFAAGIAALLAARGWRGGSMLRRFLIVSMSVLTLAIAARGLFTAIDPEFDPDLMQATGFGALYLMMLCNAFGYLLLSREKLQRDMERLEMIDVVTEVPNRRGFYHALAPWMALARRPGLPTALIVLNLDHFKRINDSYGHAAGDMVLKAMVDVCKKQLRDSDVMGRLGGAEFAIQLPRTGLGDALLVAERIRAAIENLPVKTGKAVIKLTASLGVTIIRAEDSSVSLFKRADEALQQAKQKGRNQVAEASIGTLDV